MTAKRDRLVRLLAVRTVRLRVAARALRRASATAAASAATAIRLGELHAELRGLAGRSGGYGLKAAAATRAALVAAGTVQSARLADAEARREAVQDDVRRQRAAIDAVARAADRAESADRGPYP